MNETLFPMPPPDIPPAHAGTGHTCGRCRYATRPHYYRRDWLYCSATESKHAKFGILKIKSRRPACEMFFPKPEKTKVRAKNG